MAEVSFEIVEEMGVLSEGTKGWSKQLNRVSWNGNPAKYDIRDWNEDHTKCGKGVTLTYEELEALADLI